MPKLMDNPTSSLVRLLHIGDSGSGKTGSLASLPLAGYRLWILDYDANARILQNLLAPHPDAADRVQIETLRDTITIKKGNPEVKSPPTAFSRAAQVLTEWGVDQFGPDDILVLDTLSAFSQSAFNAALFAGGRLNQRAQLQDYGWMADRVRLFIEMLTDDSINCHLIINTHVRYFAGDEDTATSARGLPNAVGQQIPTTISRYMNTVVMSRSIGSGAGAKRIISTQPQGVVEVKTANPTGVKAQYPVDNKGLAELFRDLRGGVEPTTTNPKKA